MQSSYQRKKLCATAAVGLTALSITTANAESVVEVMHFWTTGGEAALGTIRDKVVSEGVTWTDAPVDGGGGDQAKTALRARIAAGNTPAAMLMLGQNVLDWAHEGLLGNVDSLAATQGWDSVPPQVVTDLIKIDGHYVSVPTNVHRKGTAVSTFAGTHAANAAVVGAATDAITDFFNSTETPEEGATALANATKTAK